MVLTLVTRPCRCSGTARWRTVIEVVPQMKAWAPKTKKTHRATTGEVVSASARCVSVSMMSPARMTFPRLTRAVIQPYSPVPSNPPTADTVVSRPNPMAPSPSRSDE